VAETVETTLGLRKKGFPPILLGILKNKRNKEIEKGNISKLNLKPMRAESLQRSTRFRMYKQPNFQKGRSSLRSTIMQHPAFARFKL
jgi:hypothetical protein